MNLDRGTAGAQHMQNSKPFTDKEKMESSIQYLNIINLAFLPPFRFTAFLFLSSLQYLTYFSVVKTNHLQRGKSTSNNAMSWYQRRVKRCGCCSCTACLCGSVFCTLQFYAFLNTRIYANKRRIISPSICLSARPHVVLFWSGSNSKGKFSQVPRAHSLNFISKNPSPPGYKHL